MTPERIVIVGGGVAGGRAVETLRAEGYTGHLTLIGDEAVRPYERPPLSKAILQGSSPDDSVFLRPADWYAENRVEFRPGERAVGLDAAAGRVDLANGERLAYDRLLIATGATLRRLNVPGSDRGGIHYLRTLADALALRADLGGARQLVAVGMGFIGAEVAASARQLGLAVTALDPLPIPMGRVAGERVGRFFAEEHRARGVDVRLGTSVTAFEGSGGRVQAVVTADGERLPADVVVVGVGVEPAVGWLAGSGIALDNGVVTDAAFRTNLPGVFAVGDVANRDDPRHGGRVRLEHDDNAQAGGAAAARALLGSEEPFAPVPFFWSEQYDLTLQLVGHCPVVAEEVVRGDPGERSFSLFRYDAAGQLRAVMAVNRFRDLSAARRILAAGRTVSPAEAVDLAVDLRKLAR